VEGTLASRSLTLAQGLPLTWFLQVLVGMLLVVAWGMEKAQNVLQGRSTSR